MIGRVSAAMLSAAVIIAGTSAQNLRFDVSSVKPGSLTDRRVMMVMRGGRLTATNIPLRLLIRTAYQLQDDQIVDAPAWVASERFDILATAEGTPGVEANAPLLKSLLADRFKFHAHEDRRELPVYQLVRRGNDNTATPGFHPTVCPPIDDDLRSQTPCASISNGRGALTLRGMPLDLFRTYLAPYVNRVVVDRTGLGGPYDVELRWTPDAPAGAASPAPDTAPADQPSLFTAIQEQLGLKLEPGRAVVDVLVVDEVSRPDPD